MDASVGPPPVRLVAAGARHPFAPDGNVAMARVAGDGLRAFDVRDGDHVVLTRRDRAEHGDLAAVLDESGQAHLWKVYPEARRLRLSMGHPALEREVPADARIQGVVVAVMRGFRTAGSASA